MTHAEKLIRSYTFETETGRPRKSQPAAQCLGLQWLVLERLCGKRVSTVALARLIHAWCELEIQRRAIKMIPSPGQLRPDLDPVQMARAVKRSKARNPIELSQELAAILPSDASESPPSTTQPEPNHNEAAQRSEHDHRERDKISKEKGTP